MREFYGEFSYLFLFAFFVALFVKGFLPLFKIISTKIPVAGLQEALATGA